MQNPGGIGSRLISRTSAAPVFVALCGAAATSEIKYEITFEAIIIYNNNIYLLGNNNNIYLRSKPLASVCRVPYLRNILSSS